MNLNFRIAGAALALCLSAPAAFAQTATKAATAPRMSLESATVFLRGAQLDGSVTLDVPAGDSEWVLQGVSGGMDPDSLALATRADVVVLSSMFTPALEGDDDALSPEARKARDQLDAAMARTARIEARQAVIDEQLALLKENRRAGSKDGAVAAAEVTRMLALLGTTMQQALVERSANVQRLARAQAEQARVQQMFDEVGAHGFQRAGTLTLALHAPRPTRATFRLSYWVDDAGWVPSYDLQVGRIDQPVTLVQKARIFQNTGVAWNQVRLTLSSGDPARGAQAPELRTWQVGVHEPRLVAQAMAGYAPAPEASVSDRVEVTGARRRQSTLDGYVATEAAGLNVQYRVALPYTVPSDGKGHMVMLGSTDLPASYRYVATPKLDADAFLQARVRDWDRLDLLPGQSSIFHDGAYVGQGRVDVRQARDTMDVSLGRDPRILVTRKQTTERATRTGSRQQFAYTITARNTRPEPIDLVVVDQIPVSTDNRLRVEDLRYADAKLEPDTGRLEWTLRLAPGEQRELPLSYTVVAPRGLDVWGL